MNNDEMLELGNILIYQTEKGDTKIDMFFQNGDIWMNQSSIARLYNTTPQNITMHIRNIYADGELDEPSTCKDFLQVQTEGKRQIKRKKKHYNFKMILAIGYRVRSNVGMHFRNWASAILEEYSRKGFSMNDERLKNPKPFGEDYFDELLERIREIRASEKRFYQKTMSDETLPAIFWDNAFANARMPESGNCLECAMLSHGLVDAVRFAVFGFS